MIGHQAVGDDLAARPPRGLADEVAVERKVAVLEEGLLAAVAALR